MHLAQLQTEMIRYHQNIRPRYFNPTFASSNVGVSLGASLFRSQSTSTLGREKYKSVSGATLKQSNNQQERQNKGDQVTSSRKSNAPSRHRRSQSNLSNYGSNSLGPIKKYISDREIYEKQQKKYNIVTIQPKQYVDTIKLFPKYRLQNSDQSYYKKLLLQNQMTSRRNSTNSNKMFEQAIDKKLDLNPESPRKNDIANKPLRGKFLNNLDEITGVL